MNMEQLTQILVSLCAALSVAALAYLVFDLMRRVEIEKTEKTDEFKKMPILFRMMMPLVPNLMPMLKSPSMAGMVEKAQMRITMAGYDLALTGAQFVAIRFLLLFLGMIFSLLLLLGGQTMPAFLLFIILYLYPTSWLNRIVRRRHLEILKSLPNVLDLLTLSVEAGRDFLTALREIIMRRELDAIGEEFRRALHEIQLGKQRQEALREMALRVRQPDLSTVLNAIIQADELGVSIGQLLRVQGDQLRAKRFSRAEKLANEAPVKMLLPIILFIFPSVFLILLGPVMSQALKMFGK